MKLFRITFVIISPVFVLIAMSGHSTLLQLFGIDGCSHVKKHIHTPDTQSSISVNETARPLLHQVHTALCSSLPFHLLQ